MTAKRRPPSDPWWFAGRTRDPLGLVGVAVLYAVFFLMPYSILVVVVGVFVRPDTRIVLGGGALVAAVGSTWHTRQLYVEHRVSLGETAIRSHFTGHVETRMEEGGRPFWDSGWDREPYPEWVDEFYATWRSGFDRAGTCPECGERPDPFWPA